jgi:prepilin-type N-terminal cleavage/methylation domain-containing protein
MMSKQSGFTLVEIAIVLVIIALIMGGMMASGTVTIGNTKNTATISLIKDLTSGINDFKSRYRYLPGDLPNANTDIPGVTASNANCEAALSKANIGNGIIDTADEKTCVSVHLVLSGLIKGDAAGIKSPLNGGTLADVFLIAANTSAVNVAAINPFPSNVRNLIEIINIPCDAALSIDSKIDDGVATTGNVRSTVCTNKISTLDVAI